MAECSSTIMSTQVDDCQQKQQVSSLLSDRQQSSISSSASILTNSSSSLTSISTSSPTSTSFPIARPQVSSSVSFPSIEPPQLIDDESSSLTRETNDDSQASKNALASMEASLQPIEAPTSDCMCQGDDFQAVGQANASDQFIAKPNSPGPNIECRLERSNSCGPAETNGALPAASGAGGVGIGASISISHDNLLNSSSVAGAEVTGLNSQDSSSTGHLYLAPLDCSVSADSNGKNVPEYPTKGSSSRFFSSKLNTGSLWSLLSVGSSSSSSNLNPNEVATNDADHESTLSNSNPASKDKQQEETSSGGFFSRVQFKRQTQTALLQQRDQTRQQINPKCKVECQSKFSQNPDSMAIQRSESASSTIVAGQERKRFRFNVRYFGNAILHKNFTLPMLEWIAKDIKRQTVKGAQSVSQRQFSIPARDIVLEIQSYQLTALSCKDGHCIFVHPMHCVSKYAQLQHDPTCFSYLIRDTKDSPHFCHVFQAKSANKVHDIFSAIREATTQTQPSLPPASTHQSVQGAGSVIQKSSSSDGQLRSLIGQSDRTMVHSYKATPGQNQPSLAKAQLTSPEQDQDRATSAQFENSYQFEVMFVKKVKLQCRRVPASFVDDALETLKSFEVLKGGESKAQIKGIGKRIISASVDERQEYDETCQASTPSGFTEPNSGGFRANLELDKNLTDAERARRGSSVSLYKPSPTIKEERESRSCQQSPTKLTDSVTNSNESGCQNERDTEMKKHQSMDCLKSIDFTIKSARDVGAPIYSNDFSPYNTITSTDLNERIAAIPVVSSSVSLDHETRQRLARQVRETIMATAASIRKDVYASGDKLDSSTSSKALDSLSCNVASSLPQPVDGIQFSILDDAQQVSTKMGSKCQGTLNGSDESTDHRRSSAGSSSSFHQQQQQQSSSSNNFDLFRRASARQVVKNRTMLLLIGKDELCTISIDKHQMLFSKSFNSIVHCLQGNNNKDHFGLICRDSGKINPNAESYAGFIFKCQSEKVVREIMGALKQVIYNSQHNYHGYNSPYNPLNTLSSNQYRTQPQKPDQTTANDARPAQNSTLNSSQQHLITKRGLLNPIELEEAARLSRLSIHKPIDNQTAPPMFTTNSANPLAKPKNLVKSMFCDDCPLYWYHRLCCDIESLPAESSKAIILRRIDSSLTEKEQDELYSRFSEFNIESIDEHNEIFMSLLRHQCEREQFRHNQSGLHLNALAKNLATMTNQSAAVQSNTNQRDSNNKPSGHQRSGSTSGSLIQALGQTNASQASHSIVDASSAAFDNLKKAKNSISVSIENMLKRRSSIKDDDQSSPMLTTNLPKSLPTRSGSFKSTFRESRTNEQSVSRADSPGCLRRSQSTNDYSGETEQQLNLPASSWKDSLSRTINDDLTSPLVGLFRRRSSTFGSKSRDNDGDNEAGSPTRTEFYGGDCPRASADNLVRRSNNGDQQSPRDPPGSPSTSNLRNANTNSNCGGSSPSSMLSSVFWKKSIFDKIRQPMTADGRASMASNSLRAQVGQTTKVPNQPTNNRYSNPNEGSVTRAKRSREELRSLWKKAIIEQITLLKMDKQNQRLQANRAECDIQRVKLNYRDMLYGREVLPLWDKLLKQDPTTKVEFVEVAKLVKLGVPKQRRGEIWMFLMNQYQLRHGTSFQPADSEFRGDANQNYRSLLSQLSAQQHEIFVDIGKCGLSFVIQES